MLDFDPAKHYICIIRNDYRGGESPRIAKEKLSFNAPLLIALTNHGGANLFLGNMLYSIIIDQVSAMEDPKLKSLDIIDWAIHGCVRQAAFFFETEMVVVGNSVWSRVPLKLISDLLPLLRHSNGTPWEPRLILSRLSRMERCGLLVRWDGVKDESSCMVYRGEKSEPVEDKAPTGKRKAVYERDGYKCLKCGKEGIGNLVMDHVLPLAKGGHSNLCNLQTLCYKCNSEKGTQYVDYRAIQIPLDQLYIVPPVKA